MAHNEKHIGDSWNNYKFVHHCPWWLWLTYQKSNWMSIICNWLIKACVLDFTFWYLIDWFVQDWHFVDVTICCLIKCFVNIKPFDSHAKIMISTLNIRLIYCLQKNTDHHPTFSVKRVCFGDCKNQILKHPIFSSKNECKNHFFIDKLALASYIFVQNEHFDKPIDFVN